MGCVPSVEEREAIERSKAIDELLVKEGAQKSNEVKLLLLGECLQHPHPTSYIRSLLLPCIIVWG